MPTYPSGSGTSASDPRIVDTKEDFIAAIQSEEKTMYISFPDDRPESEKVLDFRKDGFYTSPVASVPSLEYPRSRYINGNGWTILGLSLRDTSFISTPSNTDGGYTIEIRNLNFKNVYLLGLTSYSSGIDGVATSLLFFIRSANSTSGGAYMYNCKISGVLDNYVNQNAKVSFVCANGGYPDSVSGIFKNCSFNIRVLPYTRTNAQKKIPYENCLFNIVGNTYNVIGGDSDLSPLAGGIFRFCRFQGKIIVTSTLYASSDDHYSSSVQGDTLFRFLTGSYYNVIDMEITTNHSRINSTTQEIEYPAVNTFASSSSNLWITDGCVNVFTHVTTNSGQAYVHMVTKAESQNKQKMLDDCNFIIGDNPSAI